MTNTSPQHKFKLANGYRLLLVVSKEDWQQSFDGDPYHEGKWMPVRDEAKDLDLMRFTNGDPLVEAATGELISEDDIREKYHLYDVDLVECCLSPNWSAEMDYYPLWELAMSEGSIDGDDVDTTVLSAWIKDGKYWCGDNGGYVEQRELNPEPTTTMTGIPEDLEDHFDEIEFEELFTGSLIRYAYNQGFDIETMDKLNQIYIDYRDSIPEGMSQSEYVEWAKRAVENTCKENCEYDISSPYFRWASILFSDLADDKVDTEHQARPIALMMLDLVKRYPQYPHLAKSFSNFMLDSTECGMEQDNYLALMEPFWSVVKANCSNDGMGFPFYTGSEERENIIDSNNWDEPVASLLEQPEVVEVFSKLGWEMIQRSPADRKAAKVKQEPKPKEGKEEIIFESKSEMIITCLAEGDISEILADPDEFMFYIGKHIEEIAELHNEVNPVALNGSEPAWLLELFESNNVATC